jgi:myo-inositol-1-phosphate synthase
MKSIRVAIAGVGNCASSLIQGLEYYKNRDEDALAGLMHARIGDWGPSDIEIVAAFDIDRRKVGKPVEEAIFAKPNCTKVFQSALPVSKVVVQMGPVLDGVAPHMADYADDEAFRPADEEPVDVVQVLKDAKAEVLVCYMPVGSEKAVRHYARACLEADVAMVNCVPVFIASDAEWAKKFRDAGLPIVGDDIKSQIGATIVHRSLTRLFGDRGVSLDRTYQLNTGGNTDFLNMKALDRLKSKFTSVLPTTCRGRRTTRSPSSEWRAAASGMCRSSSNSGCRCRIPPTARAWSSTLCVAPSWGWSAASVGR